AANVHSTDNNVCFMVRVYGTTGGRSARPWSKNRWGGLSSPMSLSFPTSEHLHKLWGGPPGPQPAPWPASRVRQEIDSKRRAGPGGPARTRGSAPLDFCRAPSFLKTKWHWAIQPADPL